MPGRDAPLLRGARLTLRPYRASDLDAQARVMADAEVARYLGGTPFSREDTWRRLCAVPGFWAMLGYGFWVAERNSDGAYLGQIGFADFKRDMDPSIEGLPEMGWIFAPEAQGQGYCSEALALALAWADSTLDASEIVAIIDPDNAASIRVAEKAGFEKRETATYRDLPILLLRRP